MYGVVKQDFMKINICATADITCPHRRVATAAVPSFCP